MKDTNDADPESFRARLSGTFHGILQWQQLDLLWERVKSGHWYFAQVGETLPERPLCGNALAARIDALNTLLKQDHDYDYCGIVYVDNVVHPTLIKVYDPNNLGSSCGSSSAPAPPRWILSTARPAPVEGLGPAPVARRQWWQRLSS